MGANFQRCLSQFKTLSGMQSNSTTKKVPPVFNNFVRASKVPLGKSELSYNGRLHNARDSQGSYVTEYTRAFTWPVPARVQIHAVPHTNTPFVNGIGANGNGTMKQVTDNGNWPRLEEIVDELISLGMKGQDLKLIKNAVHNRRLDAAIECSSRYLTEKKGILLKKKAKTGTSAKRSRMFKLCNEFVDTVRKLKKT